MKIVASVFGDLNLSDIKKEHLKRLDDFLRGKGRSNGTINHYFSLLKSLFNYAKKKKRFEGENPVNEISPYLVDEKRREYTSQELKRIIDAADKIEKEVKSEAYVQKYTKRIVLLLLYTAMRLGELFNLKWENIKNDKIIFRRTETKQKKDKIIPITNSIRKVLDILENERKKDGYVISLKPGQKSRGRVWIWELIKKIRKYSGIEDFIFHNIRHTASTIMVSQALGKVASLIDIMNILGHSKINTTLKYVHVDLERMKKVMEVLEKETTDKD